MEIMSELVVLKINPYDFCYNYFFQKLRVVTITFKRSLKQ